MLRSHRDGNQRHDDAVSRGEEQPGPARERRAPRGVEAREAVDRREVVGIEAVLQPQQEDDGDERQPVRGKRFH